MLRKLMKHEFRATGRIMLPVFALVLLASLGANLSIRGMLDSDSSFLSTLGTILIMLFTMAVIAVGIIAFFLMMNLPVSIHQQLWSKLIVSTVWFAATAVVIGLACCIMALDIRFMGQLWEGCRELMSLIAQRNHLGLVANGAAFCVEVLILCVLASFALCLRFYSAMAMGFSFSNHKLLLSVLFYLAISTALQTLGGLFISLVNDSWLHRLLLGWEPQLSAVAGMHLGIWLLILLEAVYAAVFYFLTVIFLQKHLNLE